MIPILTIFKSSPNLVQKKGSKTKEGKAKILFQEYGPQVKRSLQMKLEKTKFKSVFKQMKNYFKVLPQKFPNSSLKTRFKGVF